ncbi:MATE family efflux transporter [Helicobacter sp. faydin-H17]|uniref:MATE family efflux transporter n=2 Tax=Helicobacter kayseriensis TaxID=2905877 RepID=UPI001E5DC891|nr:MATE family efflux transporter [Helicobacter kayseriensis]MCE3047373.1 MATE family efflux transporter [Helicobacter kayseriensis]
MVRKFAMKSVDLKRDSIVRLFFYYFLPALFSMLSMSTHAIVDGFFVAHALGENTVAALGITWPVFPMLVACELLFAIGGSSLISYYLGKGDIQGAKKIFSSIIYFVLILGLCISVVLFLWTREIALFLGASIQIEKMVVDYLEIIFLGAFIMFLHPVLDMFVVNDKRPVLAMSSMIIAALGNVIFNYIFLFVMDLGIRASALATILGNTLAIVILLSHFVQKKGDLSFVRNFSLKDVLISAKNGIPASVSEMSAGIVMLLYNVTLMQAIGERGVIIYTVTMYGGIIFFTILLSIAQGIQPISSFNYGANQLARVKEVYRFGLFFTLAVSFVVYGLFYMFGEEFARAFLDSKRAGLRDVELISDIAFVMKIWFVAYLALGINMVSSIFLQSIQRPWGALLITLCYTIILTPIFLPLLKQYFGEIGIWSAYPLASVITIFVASIVLRYEFKKGVFAK